MGLGELLAAHERKVGLAGKGGWSAISAMSDTSLSSQSSHEGGTLEDSARLFKLKIKLGEIMVTGSVPQ